MSSIFEDLYTGSAGLHFTSVPSGEIDIPRLIQGNHDFWIAYDETASRKPKKIIFADWSHSMWSNEFKQEAQKLFNELHRLGFEFYESTSSGLKKKSFDVANPDAYTWFVEPFIRMEALEGHLTDLSLSRDDVFFLDYHSLRRLLGKKHHDCIDISLIPDQHPTTEHFSFPISEILKATSTDKMICTELSSRTLHLIDLFKIRAENIYIKTLSLETYTTYFSRFQTLDVSNVKIVEFDIISLETLSPEILGKIKAMLVSDTLSEINITSKLNFTELMELLGTLDYSKIKSIHLCDEKINAAQLKTLAGKIPSLERLSFMYELSPDIFTDGSLISSLLGKPLKLDMGDYTISDQSHCIDLSPFIVETLIISPAGKDALTVEIPTTCKRLQFESVSPESTVSFMGKIPNEIWIVIKPNTPYEKILTWLPNVTDYKKLHLLVLHESTGSTSTPIPLGRILNHFSNIEDLEIRSDIDCPFDISSIPLLPQLRTLSISGRSLQHVLSHTLPCTPNLKELHLQNLHIRDSLPVLAHLYALSTIHSTVPKIAEFAPNLKMLSLLRVFSPQPLPAIEWLSTHQMDAAIDTELMRQLVSLRYFQPSTLITASREGLLIMPPNGVTRGTSTSPLPSAPLPGTPPKLHALDSDTEAKDATFRATQYFESLTTGIASPHVSTYRLEIYDTIDVSGMYPSYQSTSEITLDAASPSFVFLTSVQDFTATTTPSVNTFHGKAELTIKEEWQALPSLSPQEKITQLKIFGISSDDEFQRNLN